MSSKWTSTWIVLAVVIVSAAVLILTLPLPLAATVEAKVKCTSGSPVVGVWIEAGRKGRGWATLEQNESDKSIASFRHFLPNGGNYSVHVGCGGSSQEWGSSIKSSATDEYRRDFMCHDVPWQGRYGLCD